MSRHTTRTDRANLIIDAMVGKGVQSATEIRAQTGMEPAVFTSTMRYLEGSKKVEKVARDNRRNGVFLWRLVL